MSSACSSNFEITLDVFRDGLTGASTALLEGINRSRNHDDVFGMGGGGLFGRRFFGWGSWHDEELQVGAR